LTTEKTPASSKNQPFIEKKVILWFINARIYEKITHSPFPDAGLYG
jgi:hypothetical protein